MKWVSVDEDLPPFFQSCLLFNEIDGEICFGYLTPHMGWVNYFGYQQASISHFLMGQFPETPPVLKKDERKAKYQLTNIGYTTRVRLKSLIKDTADHDDDD